MSREDVSYAEFLSLIPQRMEMREERYGQAMFNILTLCRPSIAEQLRATALDPFYRDNPSDIAHETWEMIADNWDK